MTVNADNVAAAGRAIYNEKVRHLVEPTKKGVTVYIDVNSGDFEISGADANALAALRARQPDARIWTKLVGYPERPPAGLAAYNLHPDDLAEIAEAIEREYPPYD